MELIPNVSVELYYSDFYFLSFAFKGRNEPFSGQFSPLYFLQTLKLISKDVKLLLNLSSQVKFLC